MGLDQYAGLRDSKGEVHEKFYWRKHARLQVFMSKQFNKQKKDQEHNTHDDLQHLGFNGGQGGVTITEDCNQGSGRGDQKWLLGSLCL